VAEPLVVVKLIGTVYDLMSGRSPVVVAQEGSAFASEFPWPHVEVGNAGYIGLAAQQQLSEAPILVVPDWSDLPDNRRARRDASGRTVTETALADLHPSGSGSLLGIVLPAATLQGDLARPMREALARTWRVAVVLYVAGPFPGSSASFQAAVLFLASRQRGPDATLMFRVPGAGDCGDAEQELRQFLKDAAGRGRYGYVTTSSLPPGESLLFERHDPVVLSRRADLAGFGSTISLGDLFDVPSPGIHRARDRERLCEEAADGTARILGARDIGRDKSVSPPDDHTRWAEIPPELQLKIGDILLRRIFTPSDHRGLVAAEIAAADLEAAADDTVVTLRPRDQLTTEQRTFIMLYLQSPLATKLALALSSSLAGHARLSATTLRELVLPVPDRFLTAALNHVLAAKEQLEQWSDDADALLRSVFLDESSADARARVIRAGRKLRLRVETASLVDDFGQFVRMRFPHPIAYRWRGVQAAVAGNDPADAYRKILRTAEATLGYQALLALALCHEQCLILGVVKGIRERLNTRHGPTFGDWSSILGAVSKNKSITKMPPTHPLRDLCSFYTIPEVSDALARLKARRDDDAHERSPDPVDLPEAVSAALPDLRVLLEHAQFLADWPLAHIDTVRWDIFRSSAAVTYRPMMGDQPVVPPCTTTYPHSTFEQGSLYLVDSDDEWHLLRPFLIGRDCPECKNWSTFHADRSKHMLIIKSLEHGHTIDAANYAEALRHVGLL
jgi:hypothetical protein